MNVKVRKNVYIACVVILYICSFVLLVAAGWLFLPETEPVSAETSGTIENVYVHSGRHSSVTITVNGTKYHCDIPAKRGIGLSNAEKFKIGDTVVLSYNIKSKEIVALKVKGETFLTIEEYMEQSEFESVIVGIFVTVFGLFFLGISIYTSWMLSKDRIIFKKQAPSKSS